MSELLQGTMFGDDADASTSSPADSRARTSVPPGRAPDSTVIARRSSLNSPDCLMRSDQLGFSLRMFLRSAAEALTGYSLNWTDSGTPGGRAWWVLGRWGRRTNGIASGSSDIVWPRPAAENPGAGPNNSKVENLLTGNRHSFYLSQAVEAERREPGCIGRTPAGIWPTPRTLTGGPESAERKQALGRSASGGGDLTSAVQARQEYPTPGARDYRSPNLKPYSARGGGKKGEQLPNFLAHWNTPAAQDCEQACSPKRGGLTHDARCAGPPAPARPNTTGKRPVWSTPDASSNRKSARAMMPSVNNGRRSGGGQSSPPGLEQQAEILAQSPGQLNPDWVEQLQGLPDGWTAIDDATVSRLLGTRTRRGCRTSSDGG